MKNTLPQKDYGTYERNVQLLIDERFAEKVIPANDSVRLLDRIVEEMDLSELERAYDVRGRKPATEPRIMLKILLYANMENMPIQEEMHKGQRKPQAASLQKIHCSEIRITGTNYQPGRHSAKNEPLDPVRRGFRSHQAKLRFSTVSASGKQKGHHGNHAACHVLQYKQTAFQNTE